MEVTSKILHYKLLTPTPSFNERVTASESGASPLHARLTYSWLAHRFRLGLGDSTRGICQHVGLHPTTVAAAISALAGLVERRGAEWIALAPPEGLFVSFIPSVPIKHWSDSLAYTMIFLPRKGATIKYPETSRRFGLNHSLVWSLLYRKAKHKVVQRFTVAGAAAIFGLDPKTIKAVLDDLLWLRMIERVDRGGCSDITMLPFTDTHMELFSPKLAPEGKQIAPAEKKPRTASAYVYRGDNWDACFRLCEGLMPQRQADDAISKARRLGDSPDDFESTFQRAKACHEKNILSGKVSKGNFAKYLNACFAARLEVFEKQEREQQAQLRLEAFYRSPEYLSKIAEQQTAAEADPFNPGFMLSHEAVLSRVRFSDDCRKNMLAWDVISKRLHRHLSAFVANKGLQDEIKERGRLRERILRHALSAVNKYYKQPALASETQFHESIDSAIVAIEPRLRPLFGTDEAE